MTYRIGIIGTGAAPTETKAPPAPIAEIAAQGFTPELIEPRLRTFPMTPYDRGLTALAYVDCAVEAEKAGFDAVFINTVGDYGIDETKSATNMAPVGPDIAERVSVPVFESMRTGYKTVEALLTLRVRHSYVAFPKPNRDNLTVVGALVAGQGNVDLGGDCEVCVIAEEAAEETR